MKVASRASTECFRYNIGDMGEENKDDSKAAATIGKITALIAAITGLITALVKLLSLPSTDLVVLGRAAIYFVILSVSFLGARAEVKEIRQGKRRDLGWISWVFGFFLMCGLLFLFVVLFGH
jgi:hypothetical protein